MNMTPISTERLDALRFCADAFGGDPARWPAERRAEFADLLDTTEAMAILAEARALDGFLNAATAPRMSDDLVNRVMADYVAPKMKREAPAGLFDFLRGLAPVLRLAPAGALAGVGALGMASGVMSASAQDALTPEYEALAYMDDLTLGELSDDGGLSWDAE